jgi:hypothetical protein
MIYPSLVCRMPMVHHSKELPILTRLVTPGITRDVPHNYALKLTASRGERVVNMAMSCRSS